MPPCRTHVTPRTHEPAAPRRPESAHRSASRRGAADHRSRLPESWRRRPRRPGTSCRPSRETAEGQAARPGAAERGAGPRAARAPDGAGRVLLGRAVVDGVRHRGDPADAARRRHRRAGLLAASCPITVAMVVVLAILMFSYRQTIKAYPSAGGAYIVTKDNLGLLPAQVAGVALLTDYILTVAVSVSAGTAALYSAVPGTYPGASRSPSASSPSSPGATCAGVKESGKLFAAPDLLLRGRRCWPSSSSASCEPASGDLPSHARPIRDPRCDRQRRASSCCSTPSPRAARP